MGTVIDSQLRTLGAALLLGLALALVYDLLRALRQGRRRGLTALLDALFCALLLLSGLAFALRVGEGELRLYVLLGAAAGAALYFRLLSPPLRPLWRFWARTLFSLLRLLRLPLTALRQLLRRGKKFLKRLFLFWRHAFIIASYRRCALRARRRAGVRRREVRHGGKGKEKQGIMAHPVCSGHAAARGHAADGNERPARRRAG